MLYLTRCVIRKIPGIVIKAVHLPEPEIISEFGGSNKLGSLCKKLNYKRVLFVTDSNIFSLGLHSKAIESLRREGIEYSIFSDISSEPNLTIIDNGRKAYNDFKAEAIIALGGGAVMDSCKMIAAGGRLKKKKSKSLLKKFLFVNNKTIPLITIPTTAGTGAEMTVGAVVTNNKSKKVSTVIVGLNVPGLILDGELMVKAPNGITCACAIDALSHGLEGIASSVRVSDEDMNKSMECVKLVLENLPILINDPSNTVARQNMCIAANHGGNAINKQLAGYVHAFAHTIGAKYHIPHGNAIALSILPVMNFQKNKCLKKFAKLSHYCNLCDETDNDSIASDKLMNEIEKLIKLCNFKKYDSIKIEDYKSIAHGVALDAINYSSPVVFSNKNIYATLDEINKQGDW